MSLQAEPERVASVPVEAGIFVLRYISSASETPPRVFAEVSPSSRSNIQIVFIPGKPVGVLQQPNQIALVVAERHGHLQLTVCPTESGGANARVELERLPQTAESAAADNQSYEPGDAEPSPSPEPAHVASGPSLICHVAKRGDILAVEGDWICGPSAPAVIEGFQVDWPSMQPDALQYQALLYGAAGQWSAWARAGQFVGTRGRGLAVMGLRLRLTDAAPASARLAAEAAFLGCPPIREEGRELELVSYAGADPLVGLRLRLEQGERAFEDNVLGEAEWARPEPMIVGSALRVFKSKRAGDRGLGLGD